MGVTRELADWLVSVRPEDIPDDVRHEACRAILNYVGCALGGCRDDAVTIALRVVGPLSGPPTARVLGRDEHLDPLNAALLNGIGSHVLDFDDTTPSNYVHPTAPVASALFAHACAAPVSGAAFMHAFVLGFEAETRIGDATYPAHYEAGWHSTGSVGVFGAAAAIGHLLHLSVQQMVWALGLAATQSAGLREMFGSMGKAFHPGRAAQAGYLGALLAQAGFTAGERGLEGPRGFANVTAHVRELGSLTSALGTRFGLRSNTYKPFPCGIVVHPAIAAGLRIHRARRPAAGQIAAVHLTVAPLVLDLCNKQFITRGLEGKFSVFHAAAVALVRGCAGIDEFTDAAVNDPEIKRVRELAVASADPGIAEDAVTLEVTFSDGRRLVEHVDHAPGNLAHPLSDRELEEKFQAQASPVVGSVRADALRALCWNLYRLDDCRELVNATTPQPA